MEFENGFEIADFEDEAEEQQPEKNKYQELFDWIETIVIALVSVVVIFSLFFRLATIVGPSMQNTLYENEKVIITNFLYEPKYGDIVVISRNTGNSVDDAINSREPIIKRVIATEGQYVDIDFDSGKVYVGDDLSNMIELDEPYVKGPTYLKGDVDFPVYVKEGYVFVLGDNRNNSTDSRSSSIGEEGLIDKRYILGKAIYRVWPFKSMGGLEYHEQ